MISSKMLNRLVTHPNELMRFQTTGRLPQPVKVSTALIRLLQSLSPRDLANCIGVTIGDSLGYRGSRTFHYGSQALQWILPFLKL